MRYQLSDRLRFVILDNRSVVLDPLKGKYFACNQVGTVILKALHESKTANEIIDMVTAQFNQPRFAAQIDTQQFLDMLLSRALCDVVL